MFIYWWTLLCEYQYSRHWLDQIKAYKVYTFVKSVFKSNWANSIYIKFAIQRNPLGGSNKIQLRYLWQTINTRKQQTHMACIGNKKALWSYRYRAIYLSIYLYTLALRMRNALICNSIAKLINCKCNGNCECECNFYWGNRPPQVGFDAKRFLRCLPSIQSWPGECNRHGHKSKHNLRVIKIRQSQQKLAVETTAICTGKSYTVFFKINK